jgi:hypothetical protein
VLERFLRPFLAGVLLEDRLETSSHHLDLLWRSFVRGRIGLPARGRPRSTRKPSTRSVVSRPPTWPAASTTWTPRPAAASRVAVDRPARPAPITTTSARGGIVTAPT